ncbi:MAG: CRISPR-associated endoribonuclease Cas6 [Prevotella sp.]|nr:CRISPR-associated endoribonuclease Cas6 [Prevotella sp.]
MRFRITLQVQPEVMGRELPINYQYPLQAAIYRTLAQSDSGYSTWLHENGFSHDGKRFKLFTFSNLIVPQYGINKENERLIVKSDTVTLFISFLPEKSTQRFIQGLFQQQEIQIADKFSGVQFQVRDIQVMPPLEYHPDMVFKTLSPVCVSCRNDRGKMDYLAPTDPRYELGILTGLLARYNTIHGQPFSDEPYCHIQLLNEPRSTLVRIKAGTPNETRVRGYRYQFKIDLPEELMQIAYESGLGEKGSMGFGMIEAR